MTDIRSLLGRATDWLKLPLNLALMLAILSVVAAKGFAIDIPFMRSLGPQELAYLCGAYWLVK